MENIIQISNVVASEKIINSNKILKHSILRTSSRYILYFYKNEDKM